MYTPTSTPDHVEFPASPCPEVSAARFPRIPPWHPAWSATAKVPPRSRSLASPRRPTWRWWRWSQVTATSSCCCATARNMDGNMKPSCHWRQETSWYLRWFVNISKDLWYDLIMYIHTYIPTYLPTYLPSFMHACMHTCIHAYMHTYIHIGVCVWYTHLDI